MFFFFLFRISKKTWAADGSVFFFGLAPNSTGYKVRGGIIFVVVVIDLFFFRGDFSRRENLSITLQVECAVY